jgi:hypothetical protein
VGPQKFAQPLLLLLGLLVRLQMLKSLQHCLHQLVLVGDELLNLGVGLVVGVGVVSIAIVPHVHHLRGVFGKVE